MARIKTFIVHNGLLWEPVGTMQSDRVAEANDLVYAERLIEKYDGQVITVADETLVLKTNKQIEPKTDEETWEEKSKRLREKWESIGWTEEEILSGLAAGSPRN